MGRPTVGRLRRVAGRVFGPQASRPPAGPEPGPVPRTLRVAGHRGTCVGAPENTMAAFRYAAAAGAYAAELDVQWTRATAAEPSEMVVIHDWALDRTTNGTGIVTEHTWSELSGLDAGSWYGPEWAGERLPRFAEVLDHLAGTPMLAFAELKVKSVTPEQVAAYVAAVRAAGMEGRTVASSFYTAVLRAVREASEGRIATGIIEQANPRTDDNVRGRGSSYYPVHWTTTAEQVASLRSAGVEVFTWPGREESDYTIARALGVDGITADDPAAALRWLAANAP